MRFRLRDISIKYEAPRPSAEIMAEIMDLETELSGSLEEVFDL